MNNANHKKKQKAAFLAVLLTITAVGAFFMFAHAPPQAVSSKLRIAFGYFPTPKG